MKQIIIDCQTGEETIVEIEDIIPPAKTDEELKTEYDNLVVSFIRQQYSENDELALLRKKIANLDINNEFNIYNSFVEECKVNANNIVYGGGV